MSIVSILFLPIVSKISIYTLKELKKGFDVDPDDLNEGLILFDDLE